MATKPSFYWRPERGAQRAVKPNVTATKFGDGYEQRVTGGINFTPKTWTVSFSQAGPATKDILAFLEARGGLEAFTWVDPLGDTANYVCREWQSTQQGTGVYTISATFEQVYEY